MSAATRLPLGGRLRREAVVRGASCFLSESFQSSGATCSPFPCFPLRESLLRCCQASAASRVARSAERGLFKISPYVAPSPCLKKFSKLHFSAKIVRLQSLPLGGKVDKAKLWTNEGRILFSIRIFSIKWRNLFALPLLSPSGLTLPVAD